MSLTNVNLAGKVNPGQNKFRVDFDNSNRFLQYVTVVWVKSWGCCPGLQLFTSMSKASLIAGARGDSGEQLLCC